MRIKNLNKWNRVRLLPVDDVLFEAVMDWCKKYNKEPMDAISALMSVNREEEKNDLIMSYYIQLEKRRDFRRRREAQKDE